ncbi:hypothetical protein ABT168_26895 [Streptomyces sp. NPDC001793]|uniref:hypothetical protein n=1 Tax=Streptomyces sp. NPDC001793 TaxID=3154657 RepID=UPI00333427A2
MIHNAAYNLLVLDRHGVASLEAVAPRVRDTKILAHLPDSRQDKETGWAQVPYQDEVYQRYAGLDVLLAARLRALFSESTVESPGRLPGTTDHPIHRQVITGSVA